MYFTHAHNLAPRGFVYDDRERKVHASLVVSCYVIYDS